MAHEVLGSGLAVALFDKPESVRGVCPWDLCVRLFVSGGCGVSRGLVNIPATGRVT